MIKIKILSLSAIALFALIALWSVNSCKKIDLSGTTAIINTDIYISPVLIQFQNANSSSPNAVPGGNAGFPVTISGPGAQYVVASDGSTVYQVSHGVLALALVQTALPSVSNPVTFNIYASISGYAPVTQTVTITDTSITSLVIKVSEYANPVPGSNALVTSSTVIDGVSPGITLATTPTAPMTEAASIIIPSGTQFKDINGNLINTNTINTKVIQYGTGTEAALSAFPGGFNAPNILDRNGQPIADGGTFVTAGLLQINMSGTDGTPVKQFSQPIQMNVEINSTLINPLTDAVVQVGDTIPIWSLDESTGQWKYESTATIGLDGNNKLAALFNASHLSTWNMDFLPGSKNTLKVNFHMPPGDTSTSLWPELVTTNYQYLAGLYTNSTWSQGATLYNGYSVTLSPVPNIPNATFVVDTRRGDGTSNVATTSPAVFNPSTVGSINVTITPPPTPSYINLKINIAGKCTNKNTNINVGTWVYLWPSDGPYDWTQFHDCYVGTSGWSYNNPVRLKANTNYYFATWYGGNWNSNIIKLLKQNYTFPATTVDGVVISGNGVYTASNNTLTINCTFQVRCN